MNNNKKSNIITHDGTFHSDEIFAIALIKKFLKTKVSITRTRNKELLNKGINDPETWVIDVGGVYQKENKNFDHHQRSFNESWYNSIPLSSCGLIWNYLKENNMLRLNKTVVRTIEKELITKIDMHDNGVRKWNNAQVFSSYNRQKNNDIYFNKALKSALDFLDNIIYQAKTEYYEHNLFKKEMKNQETPNIFITNINISNLHRKITHFELDSLAYVSPKNQEANNDWVAKSTLQENSNFNCRCLAPKEWWGLEGKELVEASNIEGAVFCHRNGFICVNETKEGAVKMAKEMIKNIQDD